MRRQWPMVRLGDVLSSYEEIIRLEPDAEYLQITVKLWGKGVVLRSTVLGADVAAQRRRVVRSGQLILSRIDARNGALGIVPQELDGAIVSNDFPAYTISTDRLLPGYLKWMIRTKDFVHRCRQASEGTTNRVRLQEMKFLSQEIILPPLVEQRRVVARIEELAAQIEAAISFRQQAAREADALLTSAVTASSRTDARWATVRDAVLDRKGAVRSGPFGSQLLHEEFTASGVAAIGTRDVHTHQFSHRSGWYVSPDKFEQLRRYQVFPGDLLCTIVGASIGRFCVVPDSIPLAFTTKHVLAITLDSHRVDPHFVSYMLNFHRGCRDSLFAQVEGSAQPSLNAGKVLATSLPLPLVSDQRRIVRQMDDVRQEVDALKALQAATASQIDALLPAVLSGAFKGKV